MVLVVQIVQRVLVAGVPHVQLYTFGFRLLGEVDHQPLYEESVAGEHQQQNRDNHRVKRHVTPAKDGVEANLITELLSPKN